MRIATWNINGLRARLDFVKLWLREREPDVLGLQELKLEDDKFPHDVFAELGYRALVHGQKSWNGVAVLSRKPARVERVGLPDQEEFGSRLLTAEIDGLHFATVYCPNGKSTDHADYPRKLAWYESLADHLRDAHRADHALVLCGDFNICPEAQDSWREAKLQGGIFHTEDERKRFRALLEWGMRDLFRVLHPERQAFSWWDYRGGAFHRGQGLRIDFLLGTARVAERVTAVEIDRDWRKKHDGLTASDHAPVFADLSD